jgi:hypothetical protein
MDNFIVKLYTNTTAYHSVDIHPTWMTVWSTLLTTQYQSHHPLTTIPTMHGTHALTATETKQLADQTLTLAPSVYHPTFHKPYRFIYTDILCGIAQYICQRPQSTLTITKVIRT